MNTEARPNGLDLKLRRVAERVQVKDIAHEMGISPSRVSRIEDPRTNPRVTERMERRYMAALEKCRTSRTSRNGIEAA